MVEECALSVGYMQQNRYFRVQFLDTNMVESSGPDPQTRKGSICLANNPRRLASLLSIKIR